MSVKDVFSEGFTAVNENDMLSKSLELLKREKTPVLVVVDEKENYIGVLTRRRIIRSTQGASTKVKSLMQPAPKCTLNFSLGITAKLMIESEIRYLPVFEGNKLLGFITDDDVILGAVNQRWGKTRIEGIMTTNPRVVEADKSVGGVLSRFREHGISHIPVTEKGKIVGIISIRDVIEHIFQPRQRQKRGEIVGEKVPVLSIPAGGIMTSPVVSVRPQINLKLAYKKMFDSEVSCLVVIEKGRLVGIVTKLDFLEALSQFEARHAKLGIQISVKDIELNPNQRSLIEDAFDSFINRYRKTLKTGTLFVYIKIHGGRFKGEKLVHCRLQLRTAKGSFFSHGEGWGVEATFRVALDRLEKRILRSKELSHEPKFAKDFLERIGFSSKEL